MQISDVIEKLLKTKDRNKMLMIIYLHRVHAVLGLPVNPGKHLQAAE